VNRPVVPRRPARGAWSQWLLIASAVGAVAIVGVFAYQRGQLSAGHDAEAGEQARQALQDRAERLERQNQRLNSKVAELEMARRLDRDAYGQIERTLGDLQSQLARQGDDLAFYRSIVSPEDGIQGLRIQRFAVDAGTLPREFVLKLTLVQAMRHESNVSGLAQITVNGVQGGRPAAYTVAQLTGRPRAQLPFAFRYFQTLEQAVTLPEGFEALQASVEVRASKLRQPIQRSFAWKVGGSATLSTAGEGG
jgi:hypothetical protein